MEQQNDLTIFHFNSFSLYPKLIIKLFKEAENDGVYVDANIYVKCQMSINYKEKLWLRYNDVEEIYNLAHKYNYIKLINKIKKMGFKTRAQLKSEKIDREIAELSAEYDRIFSELKKRGIEL